MPNAKTRRTTPGRATKNNKRKISEGEEEQARAVKPRTEAGTMSVTLEQLRQEFAASEERISKDNEKTFKALTDKIDQNSSLIRAERDERREEMRRMEQRINELGEQSTKNAPAKGTRPSYVSRADDLYNKYQRSRRSLLIYPIKGEGLDAMLASLQHYCNEILLIPKGELQRSQIELVRRYRGTKMSRSRNEAIVVFADNETRDYVQSHAKNLAGKKDYGLRLEVPPHLLGVKRTFDEYGYVLKEEIGEEFKRNVRYDDANETLCMDVYYPDADKWERLTHRQALDGLAEKKDSPLAVQEEGPPVVKEDSRSMDTASNTGILRPSNLTTAARTAGGGVWRA